MKKIFITTILITLSFADLFAQKAEQEIRTLIENYDKASLKNDIPFFERLFAADYIISTSNGSTMNRTVSLADMQKQKDKPTYKFIATKSDSVQVKVSGNMAVVTGKWLSTTQALDDPTAKLHNDVGRYTSVLEKRNGKWMMIAEHVSEKPHTAAELEPGVRKASEDYDKAWETKNAELFSSLLTDDYMSTNETGKIRYKTDDIAQMTSADLVLTSNTADDKKFRMYRNTAVETGHYSVSGSYKGKAFSENGRYTSTWIYRDGKWKMAADHTSHIPAAAAAPGN
ncbi:MAG: nuclear transport factor 2 family protein [Ferruginibacter sp.]